jgi:hypothetical protein
MLLRSTTTRDVTTLFDIRCSVTENYQSREELAGLGITVESVRKLIAGGDYVTTLAETQGRAVGRFHHGLSLRAASSRPSCGSVSRAGLSAARSWKQPRTGCGGRVCSRPGSPPGRSRGCGPEASARGFYRGLAWTEVGYLGDGQVIFRKRLRAGDREASAPKQQSFPGACSRRRSASGPDSAL